MRSASFAGSTVGLTFGSPYALQKCNFYVHLVDNNKPKWSDRYNTPWVSFNKKGLTFKFKKKNSCQF